MKHREFYTLYKTRYRPLINPIFQIRNWWRILLITLVAVLIGPLIVYKTQRAVSFTLYFYLQVFEYCFLIAVPFVSFLFWLNWRESVKRTRGYGWVGKFEVINKQYLFIFCYLQLAPGNSKLKVERSLFEKTRIGDYILIRRDALGNIEEVKKVNNLSYRLGKTETKHVPKGSSGSPPEGEDW